MKTVPPLSVLPYATERKGGRVVIRPAGSWERDWGCLSHL